MKRHACVVGLVCALWLAAPPLRADPEPWESQVEHPEVERSRLEKQTRALDEEQESQAPVPMAAASGAELFLTIPAEGFQLPKAGADGYVGNSRFCNQDHCGWLAPVQVTHGARIVGIELEACDTQQFVSVYLQIVVAFGLEGGSLQVADLFSSLPSDPNAPGCHYFMKALDAPFVVDQFLHSLYARVSIGRSSCATTPPHECPTSDTRFRSVRIYYEPSKRGTLEPESTAPFSVFP